MPSQPPDETPGQKPAVAFPPLPDYYPRRIERPTAVFAGCVMAGLGGLAGLTIGFFLLSMSTDSPALNSVPPADRGSLISGLHIVGGIAVAWCPVVILAAIFAFRGARWAALSLVGMAAVYALVSIAGALTGSTAQGGLGLIWALVSAALVYASKSAREWFRAMSSPTT